MPRKRKADVRTEPEAVVREVVRAEDRTRWLLSDFLPGDENQGKRDQIIRDGRVPSASGKTDYVVHTKKITMPDGSDDYEIVATAAILRNPGLTNDLVDEIDDFSTSSERSKAQQVDLYWRIYNTEGSIHTGVNRVASLLSGGGRFKVRKAKKGKKQKAQEQLQLVLDEVVKNINNAPIDGVVKGARGLKAITQQGVRQCLVEGDWMGRTVWTEHQVGTEGTFSLPMTVQSMSMRHIETIPELAGTGIEAFYWKPDESLIRQLQKPVSKEVGTLLKRYIPNEVKSKLIKDKRWFLDPALLLHVKYQGTDTDTYGESYIRPALLGIVFKRAVEALDLVSMKNLINRLTILKVGSSDKESPFRDAATMLLRQQLMQQMVEDPGPNMLIVWAGDDVDVLDVGAHDKVLELNERHKLGEAKIRRATGMPDTILDGSNEGTKSSALASMLAVGAALDELQSAFEQVWSTLGERIAIENGFTDFEIIFEFDNSLFLDRMEEWNQRRLDYTSGGLSIRSYLAALGIDPEAEFLRKCFEKGLDPGKALWIDVFAPLAGLPGQGVPSPDGTGRPVPPGQGDGKSPGGGRDPDSQTGKPATPPTETKTPVENK